MLRLDDISDNYRVKSGGHPSDTIAAMMAAGEAVKADGASVINAITIAYDVYCSFCESFDLNSKGWDQPVYGVLAGALGAGRLLKLTREQMGNAVALALTPNMALFQTRTGDLSSWKGCAGGNASRNALFAAFLARDGFTGPNAAFEGRHGFFSIVGRFDWKVIADAAHPHRITQTHFKCFSVCGHGQSATQAAVEIHPRREGGGHPGRPGGGVQDGRRDDGERPFALGADHPRDGRPQPAVRRRGRAARRRGRAPFLRARGGWWTPPSLP